MTTEREQRAREVLAQAMQPHGYLGEQCLNELTAACLAFAVEQEWRTIDSAPKDVLLLGYSDGFDNPYWVGQKYDLLKNALIDFTSGRWRICSHFRLLCPPAAPAIFAKGEQA